MKITRRALLGLIGSFAGALLAGCGPDDPGPRWWKRLWSRKTAASVPPCIVRPEQTEGPYFVDERLDRSDIRSDPSDRSVKEGAPLQLTIRVHEIRGAACTPLANAVVDLWHCDALGVYGDVHDRAFDTRGRKFLRGFQRTGADGKADFRTIYPGWYPGRTVHIHFKIRTDPDSRRGEEFTSQIYFDDLLTDQVHARAPYNVKEGRRSRNRDDGIFEEGGDQLIVSLGRQGEGYGGAFDIGLDRS